MSGSNDVKDAGRADKTTAVDETGTVDGGTWSNGIAAWLFRWRGVLLLIALGLLAGAWWKARELKFNRAIESLYAASDPQFVHFQQSKVNFGGDEFAIVAYTDPKLLHRWTGNLQRDATERILQLRQRLNRVKGIKPESTQDLAAAHHPQEIRLKSVPPVFLPLVEPFLKEPKVLSNRVNNVLRGILLGYDNQTTAVIVRLLPESASPVSRGETIAAIREVARGFTDETGLATYVVGEPVQVHEMFRYVEEDGSKLFRVSLALLAVVLLILLRSVRWVILPLLIVLLSIHWTEALLVISQAELSMVSSMLNSLVTIIGVATTVHVAVAYRSARSQLSPRAAFVQTFRNLGPAIVWTCLTTAVGFAALISSQITPVRSFGLMMSLATMLVLLAAAMVLPSGLLLAEKEGRLSSSRSWLSTGLVWTSGWIEQNGRLVLAAFVFMFVVAAGGVTRVDIETDFSQNFRDDSDIVQSLEFAENPDHLGGAGTWEVNFAAPAELTPDYLASVRQLAERLRSRFTRADGSGRVTKVFALPDALDVLPKVPIISNTLEKRLEILQGALPEMLPTFYAPSQQRMRILLRARERVPADEKKTLISEVDAVARDWAQAELTPQGLSADAKPTGLYVLLAFLTQSLLNDQQVSFALAAAGIGLMMWLAFGRFRVAVVALFPNLFPIVLVIGGMGWSGVKVNIATAMIASVSMGLTVDSSVHYISGYQRARRRGADHRAALALTHSQVGRALILANIALVAGFSVLMLSDFIPLIYFGGLVNLAMLGGLAGNLLLLPVLLGWAWRDDHPGNAGSPTNRTQRHEHPSADDLQPDNQPAA